MAAYISSATKRLPILKETEYDFLLNTPDAFTPDGRWILGEAPEIGNYFVCAGARFIYYRIEDFIIIHVYQFTINLNEIIIQV